MKTAKWVRVGLIVWILLSLVGCSKGVNGKIFKVPKTPQRHLKSLYLENFTTQADDDLSWGPYCTRILHEKLEFAPNEILYIPFYPLVAYEKSLAPNILEDNAPSGNLDKTRYLAKIYGVDNILQGKIIKKGDSLRFEGELINLSSNKILQKFNLSGNLNNPSGFFNQFSQEVLNRLQVPLSPEQKEYLSRNNTGNGKAFKVGVEAYSLPGVENIKSMELYAKAIEKDPEFLFVKYGHAVRQLELDYKEGLAEMDRLMINYPQYYSPFLYNLYKREWNGEDANASIQIAFKILRSNPENMVALSDLVFARINQQQFDESDKVAQNMMNLYPDCWYSHLIAGYSAEQRARSVRKGRYYNEMNPQEEKIYRTYSSEALSKMRQCVKMNPYSPRSLGNLIGELLGYCGHLSEIESSFTKATTMNPHYYFVYDQIQWVYAPGYTHQPEKQQKLLAEGIRLNPDNPDFSLGYLYMFSWYQEVHPDSSDIKLYSRDTQTLANIWTSLSQYPKDYPRDFQIFDRAANLYQIKGDTEKAWYFYTLIPDNAEAVRKNLHEFYLRKAQTAKKLQKYPLAFEYADKCLQASPCRFCETKAILIKGFVAFTQKDTKKGFQNLEMALEHDGEDLYSLSEFAYYSGQYDYKVDKGIECIQKAINGDPEDARYYAILARLYYSKKDKAQALKYINEALWRDTKDPWFLAVKEKIKLMP